MMARNTNRTYLFTHIFYGTLLRILLISGAIIVIYPLLWNLITSFKTSKEILANPWTFPATLNFQNYINAFTKARMGDYLLNTLYVVLLSLFLMLLFCVPMSYCLARLKFRFAQVLNAMYMACLFIQGSLILIPLYLFLFKLHMVESRTWLSLMYAVLQFPFCIFLLTGYLKSIPKDYEDAAMIDGCSYFSILLKIIIPMSKSALVTIMMMTFFGFLNEYPLALTFITTEKRWTLAVGLVNLYEVLRYKTDWGALFAGLIIITLPTMIMFLIGQKKLVEGISIGGLKG
jgi:N-acetylglucosamine transport system permease protein